MPALLQFRSYSKVGFEANAYTTYRVIFSYILNHPPVFPSTCANAFLVIDRNMYISEAIQMQVEVQIREELEGVDVEEAFDEETKHINLSVSIGLEGGRNGSSSYSDKLVPRTNADIDLFALTADRDAIQLNQRSRSNHKNTNCGLALLWSNIEPQHQQ
nr:myb-related protein 1-like isoform X2 [Ipomoea trifida]